MQIRQNITLKDYTTMRLGDQATAVAEVTTTEELVEAITWATEQQLPFLVLGGGSNVIFRDGYHGLIIHNRIAGFSVLHSDATGSTIRVGAGEEWDTVVERTVAMELSGIEALSAIPGTAGATPVQNVGAYGQEIADTFVELEAYDLHAGTFIVLDKKACQFSYRHSIFKSVQDRRYIITTITLRLEKTNPTPPFYESLQHYFDEHHITQYTPQTVRDAVIAIRARKLPDPQVMANTGSFFKNPIVPQAVSAQLLQQYPDMPHWPTSDGQVKLSAGWLIASAGLKGYAKHGMKVYEANALVFVNEAAKDYDDLAAFRDEVVQKVQQKFGVTLEQEPELL